jgi:hypothetical protein
MRQGPRRTVGLAGWRSKSSLNDHVHPWAWAEDCAAAAHGAEAPYETGAQVVPAHFPYSNARRCRCASQCSLYSNARSCKWPALGSPHRFQGSAAHAWARSSHLALTCSARPQANLVPRRSMVSAPPGYSDVRHCCSHTRPCSTWPRTRGIAGTKSRLRAGRARPSAPRAREDD